MNLSASLSRFQIRTKCSELLRESVLEWFVSEKDMSLLL